MKSTKWEVIGDEPIMQHPDINLTMQEVQLPDGEVISDWPMVHVTDYINVMVCNKEGKVLVLEGYRHGLGRTTWQVVSGVLKADEDPISAAQREMLEQFGYESSDLRYLSSFVMHPQQHVGTGHFFLANNARKVAEPTKPPVESATATWLDPDVLYRALWDGRVGVASYAMAIGMGLMALANGNMKRTLQALTKKESPSIARGYHARDAFID